MRHQVFISYAREDESVAAEIERELRDNGYSCWWDPAMRAGFDWQDQINEHINESHVLLVVASGKAAKSQWVHREIGIAQDLGKAIVPVKFEERIPAAFEEPLGNIEFVTFPGGEITPGAKRKLIAALRDAGLGVLDHAVDRELNWKHLEGKFPQLQAHQDRLERIADQAHRSFIASPGDPMWTVNGLRHANGLLYALTQILDERERADPLDAFCLVAAACLHDMALVLPEYRDHEFAEVRHNHAEWSADWLKSNRGNLQLNNEETDTIEALIRYHNPRTDIRGLADRPRLATLASAFRLANTCDAGESRAPTWVWEKYRERITQPEQVHFWLIHSMISSVVVDSQARTIFVHERAPSEDLLFIPDQFYQEVERRYEPLMPFIGRWRVEREHQINPNLTLPISREDMVGCALQFLASPLGFLSAPGASLPSSSELLDRFVDSARSISASDYKGPKSPRMKLSSLKHLLDELLGSRGELHLLHALKRTTQDAERDANGKRLSDDAALHQVADAIEDFRRERRFVRTPQEFGEIVEDALSRLSRPRLDSRLRVLVFGKSGPVMAFLSQCASPRRRLEVFTPVMRPVGEGATLHVPAAIEELQDRHIEAVIVPDAAIAHVLTGPGELGGGGGHDSEEEGLGCDVVLMGCEAVFVRGRRKRADIGTSLGALSIAQLAKTAGVPVWAVTDRAKFVAYRDQSPWYGAKSVQRVRAEAFMHEPDAARWTEKRPHSYPRSEVVPGELVDYIITEEAVYTPQDAAQLARELSR